MSQPGLVAGNTILRRDIVHVRTLSTVLERLDPVSDQRSIYRKVDTQGFDLAILCSAGSALERVKAFQTELAVKNDLRRRPHLRRSATARDRVRRGRAARRDLVVGPHSALWLAHRGLERLELQACHDARVARRAEGSRWLWGRTACTGGSPKGGSASPSMIASPAREAARWLLSGLNMRSPYRVASAER